MTDAEFRGLVARTLKQLTRSLDDLDADALEPRPAEGVLAFEFDEGAAWVLSQQAPVQELWLAAERQAWHFRWDGSRWMERDRGVPLEDVLSGLLSSRLGRPVRLA